MLDSTCSYFDNSLDTKGLSSCMNELLRDSPSNLLSIDDNPLRPSWSTSELLLYINYTNNILKANKLKDNWVHSESESLSNVF